MPQFQYEARDASGQTNSGSLEARSTVDAVNQLRSQGLRVERLLGIEPDSPVAEAGSEDVVAAADGPLPPTASRTTVAGRAATGLSEFTLGIEDLAEIAGRIAGIAQSKLPLAPGLRALSEELPSRSLKRALSSCCDRLDQGDPLEVALRAAGAAIPGSVAAVLLLGIRSNRLADVMEWYLRHLRRKIDMRRRFRAALFYPAALLVFGVLTAAFGLLWVIPSLQPIYNEFGIQLPFLTSLVFWFSDFAVNYGLFLVAAALVVAAGVPLLVRFFGGRILWHQVLAAVPFFGNLRRCGSLAAFCDLLSMFVSSELPLPEGVQLAGQGTEDADLESRFNILAVCLAKGHDEREIDRRLAQISPHLVQVFQQRERGTTFTEGLNAAANIFQNQTRLQLGLGGMLLEPIVILSVLAVIGFMLIAVFLPLMHMLNGFV